VRMARRIVYGLDRTDIQFVLAGSGPEAAAIRDLVIAEGLKEFVTCLPSDDRALVASILSSADVAVDPTPPSHFGALIESAPLLTYAMLGVPTIAFQREENVIMARHLAVHSVPKSIPELARGTLDALAAPLTRGNAAGTAPLWAEKGGPAYVAAIQQALQLEQ